MEDLWIINSQQPQHLVLTDILRAKHQEELEVFNQVKTLRVVLIKEEHLSIQDKI